MMIKTLLLEVIWLQIDDDVKFLRLLFKNMVQKTYPYLVISKNEILGVFHPFIQRSLLQTRSKGVQKYRNQLTLLQPGEGSLSPSITTGTPQFFSPSSITEERQRQRSVFVIIFASQTLFFLLLKVRLICITLHQKFLGVELKQTIK